MWINPKTIFAYHTSWFMWWILLLPCQQCSGTGWVDLVWGMTACKMLSVLQSFQSEWKFHERMIWGEERQGSDWSQRWGNANCFKPCTSWEISTEASEVKYFQLGGQSHGNCASSYCDIQIPQFTEVGAKEAKQLGPQWPLWFHIWYHEQLGGWTILFRNTLGTLPYADHGSKL